MLTRFALHLWIALLQKKCLFILSFLSLSVTSEKSQDAHVNDEDIKVQVDIPAHEVQVFYVPHAEEEVILFQNGVETDEGFRMFGDRIRLTVWSGLLRFRITRAQPSDAGQYNIYDKEGHLAMTMFLNRDPGKHVCSTKCGYKVQTLHYHLKYNHKKTMN